MRVLWLFSPSQTAIWSFVSFRNNISFCVHKRPEIITKCFPDPRRLSKNIAALLKWHRVQPYWINIIRVKTATLLASFDKFVSVFINKSRSI
jgi:hypothetical protein